MKKRSAKCYEKKVKRMRARWEKSKGLQKTPLNEFIGQVRKATREDK